MTMLDKLILLCQIACSIAEIHSVGVVHGDLKPANFLLTDARSLNVRISDFGMSDARQALNDTGTIVYARDRWDERHANLLCSRDDDS